MLTGRADDVLLLVNGEKASPALLEAALRSSADITDALVFGANRASLGVAIIPATRKVERQNLLDAIKAANRVAPSHAQISPELLIVLPPDTQFPKASKGSLQRGRAYEAFAIEIEEAYRSLGQSLPDLTGSVEKSKLVGDDLLAFIRDKVAQTMGGDELDLNEDLFSAGLNSLQSVRVRNMLQQVQRLTLHR